MQPKIIKKGKLIIAGIMGDGRQTAELWESFEKKNGEKEIKGKIDGNGYEIRFHYDNKCDCFVGFAVSDESIYDAFQSLILPPSEYAVFDVVVAKGYDSENQTMNKWLANNSEKYIQSEIDGKSFVIECYNERFKDGIVEIWIPIHMPPVEG